MSSHPLYGTWADMMSRCYNPRVRSYRDYGAKGIGVCERWHDPRYFIEDIERLIGSRPDGMTLDRVSSAGNYEPGKVRWATKAQQVQNSCRYIDGTRKGALYAAWWRLMRRCPDEVCPAWHNWAVFRDEIEQTLGTRPADFRFDRIDDQQPYELGNVAWVTGAKQIKRAQQARWGASRPEPKHGMCRHPLYRPWVYLMNERPDELHGLWQDVRAFIRDVEIAIGPKPPGMVFRRIDPDGAYEPGNVCWGPAGRPARAQ
jgi:hypothetical protein